MRCIIAVLVGAVNCEAKKASACATIEGRGWILAALMNVCACACSSCVVKSCPCKWGAGVSDAGVG